MLNHAKGLQESQTRARDAETDHQLVAVGSEPRSRTDDFSDELVNGSHE